MLKFNGSMQIRSSPFFFDGATMDDNNLVGFVTGAMSPIPHTLCLSLQLVLILEGILQLD